MMQSVIVYLWIPLLGVVAGGVVMFNAKDHVLSDNALVRDFCMVLGVLITVFIGISRTEYVKLRLNPQYRFETERDADPLYRALGQSISAADKQKLDAELNQQHLQGASLDEAFRRLRPWLIDLTNAELGWADAKSRVAWGQVTLDSLKELQRIDSTLCWRSVSQAPPAPATLAGTFSEMNGKAFRQAAQGVHESKMAHLAGKRASDEKIASRDEASQEYRLIEQTLTAKFGEPLARLALKKGKYPATPVFPSDQLCAAKIDMLEQVLERPNAIATTLVDAILR